MTADIHSRHAEITSFSFIREALKGMRRINSRSITRRHLLGLDDHLLRDMGISRLDVLQGNF